jgi:hypothetical protein
MLLRSVLGFAAHVAVVASSAVNGTATLRQYQNSSSVASSTTEDVHLGGFIALGLGLGITSDESSSSSSVPSTQDAFPSSASPAITGVSGAPPTLTRNVTVTQSAIVTLLPVPMTRSQAVNASIDLNQCWNSWSNYWEALPNYGTNEPPRQESCLYTYAPTTVSQAMEMVETSYSKTPFTYTYTRTDVVDNNGFATSTHVVTTTMVGLENDSDYPITTVTRTDGWTYVQTSSCYTHVTPEATGKPSPDCVLPTTRLSQCQASWDTWLDRQMAASKTQDNAASDLDGGALTTAPSCTQATVGDALCTSVKDAYVSSSLNLTAFSRVLPSIYSKVEISMSGGYYRMGGDEWKWPSTAYFGPSCTL